MQEGSPILVVAVGNSRVRLGRWVDGQVLDARALPHAGLDPSNDELRALAEGARGCVVASTHRAAAASLEAAVRSIAPGCECVRIGRDLAVPIRAAIDNPEAVGQDRLLNAYAAFTRARQACVVVDAGTAVTIDFVDGEGVFQGGMIAPGLRLMLASLHEHTDALPSIEFEPPDPDRGPFGKDTAHAMRLGARAALVGLVRHAVEGYADAYGAYPQIIATGGDAPLLDTDGVVEHIVPDLQLLGIGLTLEHAGDDDDED